MPAASAATPPVIEIRDLHKSFGSLDVLRGVDLTAHAGEVIALIGSSGSGKSTLLRCANLLEDSQSGEILFEGEPVRWKGTSQTRRPSDAEQIRRIRTNLSMVFQQFNLWAHLTILQNVMEAPVSVLGQPKAEVEARARAYRAASNNARPSRVRFAWSRGRFCSMNRPRPSTPSWNKRWCA
jgi:polar amino acid transport system ATP-binding protein